MLHMLAAFAELERALTRERQAEDIRIAKSEAASVDELEIARPVSSTSLRVGCW